MTNAEKVAQVTALYNQLNVKEAATQEANKHTDIALVHLNQLHADVDKKEALKQFGLQLLNRAH